MGRQDEKALHRPFTTDHIKDKTLVIKMLEFEEEFSKSAKGQMMYKNPLNKPYTSLVVEKAINRITLDKFKFDTSDESVENYRKIFRTYYRSPDDYDKDVINSVHYMRENKCVFYKKPVINVGEKIPNCELVERDGKTKTTLYDAIKKEDGHHTVFAAFSLS